MRKLFAAIVALLVLTMLSTTAVAASVEPTLHSGNPTCGEFNSDWIELRVDPVNAGVYSDGYLTVTITLGDNKSFSWTSNIGVDAVFVKGGPGGNLYQYDPPSESFGDSGLHSPENPNNGRRAGLSHISFCYDFELDVSKTVETSFTREYPWEIEKSVSPTSADLFVGDSISPTWTVDLTRGEPFDSDHRIFGSFTMENNTPFDATGVDASDVIEGQAATITDCNFPLTLVSDDSLTCHYELYPGGVLNGTNTVTVTTTGTVGGNTATAPVNFTGPTTVINESVDVTDDLVGNLGSSDSEPFVYSSIEYTCNSDEGGHNNTATITQTGQSDDATFTLRCHVPDPSKNATPVQTDTYDWDIDKSIDVPQHDLLIGDVANWNWTVAVTQYISNDYSVSGVITVGNTHPSSVMNVTVADVITGGIVPALDCGGVLAVPAGGSADCGYSASLPNADDRVNTVTVTLNGHDYPASADIVFGAPNVIGFTQVNVSDSNGGGWVFDQSNQVSYPDSYTCGDGYDFTNTATITELNESDSASVDVNCYGHSVTKSGSGSYLINHEWTPFKSCDPTYIEIDEGETANWECTVGINYNTWNSDFAYSGGITVNNSAPFAVNFAISDPGVGILCGGVLNVPANSSAVCYFGGNAGSADAIYNTATATNPFGYSQSGSTTINFSGSNVGYNPVSLSDSNGGFWDGLVGNFSTTYPQSYLCGPSTDFHNVVTIVETGQNADADVQVVCIPPPPPELCSPGYWKNHISEWPNGLLPSDSYNVLFGTSLEWPDDGVDVTLLDVLSNQNIWHLANDLGDWMSLQSDPICTEN